MDTRKQNRMLQIAKVKQWISDIYEGVDDLDAIKVRAKIMTEFGVSGKTAVEYYQAAKYQYDEELRKEFTK